MLLRIESLDLLAVRFVVDEMHSFCLLTSMKLILIPNCSSLYLHSNDVNSLKSLLLNKVIAINIIIKTHK